MPSPTEPSRLDALGTRPAAVDAVGVAALWTRDGVYDDGEGRALLGRSRER